MYARLGVKEISLSNITRRKLLGEILKRIFILDL